MHRSGGDLRMDKDRNSTCQGAQLSPYLSWVSKSQALRGGEAWVRVGESYLMLSPIYRQGTGGRPCAAILIRTLHGRGEVPRLGQEGGNWAALHRHGHILESYGIQVQN